MADPAKEQIAQAAVAKLQAARIAAGYRTEVGSNVMRRRPNVAKLNQTSLPFASVWIGSAKPESDRNVTGFYRELATLAIECWYRSAEEEDLDSDGIAIEADVKQAILTDTTLGLTGLAVIVRPLTVQADNQEFGDSKIGRRVIQFEVQYQWTAATP